MRHLAGGTVLAAPPRSRPRPRGRTPVSPWPCSATQPAPEGGNHGIRTSTAYLRCAPASRGRQPGDQDLAGRLAVPPGGLAGRRRPHFAAADHGAAFPSLPAEGLRGPGAGLGAIVAAPDRSTPVTRISEQV